jgi:type II secretory pathway component PulC
MNGFKHILRATVLTAGLVALLTPTVLLGQTAEEKARIQELRALMEARLQTAHQERLQHVEEALARAKEALARAEEESRGMRAVQLQEMERALSQARAQAYLTQERQEQVLQQALSQLEEMEGVRSQARAQAYLTQERQEEVLRQARQQLERERVRGDELRLRLEEELERARQEIRRDARQVVVRVRSRVRLGVSLDSRQGAEYDRRGARIESVLEDTPAEEVGLQEGDIITHLNGRSLLEPIPDESEEEFDEDGSLPVQRLMALAADLEAGDEVEVRYLRDGAPGTVTFEAADTREPSVVVLEGDLDDPGRRGLWTLRLPEDLDLELRELRLRDPEIRMRALPEVESFQLRTPRGESPLAFEFMTGRAGFGLELTPLNPGLAEYFSTDTGLLVLNVDEDSTLGLLPGDVLLAIDGREVEEVRDVGRILRSYERDEVVSFTVMRKGIETRVEGTVR